MGLPRRAALSAWRQPAPWIALGLLAIASTSTQPRLWFWVALLVVVLVVGWIQAVGRLRR
ncbi:MAG: hypothetical protein NTZ53_01470 [Cyanobacteria bacterium]|nr:hypothetical protein [Cyanobacteriota bacterium]